MENKTQSVKISSGLYKKLKNLANVENRFIGFLLDRAVKNYLISKKIIKDNKGNKGNNDTI